MNILFDTKDFVPRMECGNWPLWLIIAYITTNWIIAASYYSIPITLYIYWKKKRLAIEKHWIILLFIGFIFLCGTTHIFEGLTFWWPAYRFLTLIDFLTASISSVTAVMLIPVIRFKFNYKTPKEYEQLQKKLEEEVKEKEEILKNVRETNHELANRVQYLQNIISTQGWISGQQLKLEGLKHIVETLRKEYKTKIEV